MTTYPPKTAAQMAGVSNSTIRNYLKQYDGFFSAGASPKQGDTRALNIEDIAKIRLISQLKKISTSDEDIATALTAGEWSNTLLEIQSEQSKSAVTAAALDSAMSVELATTKQLVGLLRERIEGMDGDISDYKREVERLNNKLNQANREAGKGEVYREENERLRAEIEKLRSDIDKDDKPRRRWFGR